MSSEYIIETERLGIRRFECTDLQDLSEILTDDRVTYFEPYNTFLYEECKKEVINLSNSKDFFAVVLKDQHKVIGKIYFHDLNSFNKWEIGYTFNYNFQKHGYAFESISKFIEHVFKDGNVRKIIAEINGRNINSQKLAEKLGMVREACLKKDSSNYKDDNGNLIWDDKLIYGILKN